jgi:hypothetical protein
MLRRRTWHRDQRSWTHLGAPNAWPPGNARAISTPASKRAWRRDRRLLDTPGLASQDAANACSCGTPSRVAVADGGTMSTGTGAVAASRNDTEPNRAARSGP